MGPGGMHVLIKEGLVGLYQGMRSHARVSRGCAPTHVPWAQS